LKSKWQQGYAVEFKIEPHRGIGPVSLGMSRAEVAAIMDLAGGGSPQSKSKSTDCFFENAFQVSFDEIGIADFIEVSNNVQLVFSFKGHDVFDMLGSELIALLQELDQPDPDLSSATCRAGSEYTFPGLILTLWELDSQYDHKGGQKRPMFGAVGVGTEHYLATVGAIRSRHQERRRKRMESMSDEERNQLDEK
jgi:hypothetical protein